MNINRKVVQCGKYPIAYTLITEQVKDINMRIPSEGEVVVNASLFAPMDKINDFVSNRVSWIARHRRSMQERNQKSMVDDKRIILFRNSLKIRKTAGERSHVSYDKDTLYIQCRKQTDPEKVIRQSLDKPCRDAFLDITTLTFRSLSGYRLGFSDAKIQGMKSRWGSCIPTKSSITLNRKLIHYSFESIEYVVLHEFVHFIQPDHSKAFYNIIENYISDYKTHMGVVNQEREKSIMIHIITNALALFTVTGGNDMGAHTIPLYVSIRDEHYQNLCFDTSSFLKEVHSGGIPTTSQPSIGDVLAAYGEHGDEEILGICMADGPLGTYQTMLMAKEQAPNVDSITVLNSRTLCGPHRYLVEKAVRLCGKGKEAADIVAALKESMAHERPFLIPQDYSFLERGEHLKPAAASIGGPLKLRPVTYAVGDGSRLDKSAIACTLSKAADSIISYFREHGVDAAYRISVSHADALVNARFPMDRLRNAFPNTELELLELSPAFITQGGS